MKFFLLLLLAFINSVNGKTCYFGYWEDDCDRYVSKPSNDHQEVTDDKNTEGILFMVFGLGISFFVAVCKKYHSYIKYKNSHPNEHLPTYNEANGNTTTLPSYNCLNADSNAHLPTYEEANAITTFPINNDQNGISDSHLPTYEETMTEYDIIIVCTSDYSSNNNNNATNNINHSVSVV